MPRGRSHNERRVSPLINALNMWMSRTFFFKLGVSERLAISCASGFIKVPAKGLVVIRKPKGAI